LIQRLEQGAEITFYRPLGAHSFITLRLIVIVRQTVDEEPSKVSMVATVAHIVIVSTEAFKLDGRLSLAGRRTISRLTICVLRAI